MTRSLHLRIDRLSTPLGELAVVVDDEDHLRVMEWTDQDRRLSRSLGRLFGAGGYDLSDDRDPAGLTRRMEAYFEGDLGVIDDIPLVMTGTAFQKEVWTELRRIPCGTTISYGELARRIRKPAAMRAVGLANGANPIGIVVPCHRVIGANGTLTGYGGGIERKRWLLTHEAAVRPESQLPLAFWS